jgi:hypothetical protein
LSDVVQDIDRIVDLVDAVGNRCRDQPHLDDFLLWNAGTLEYWLHIEISSIGQEVGWAARTEVPYLTGCPSPTSKSDEKWCDGAVVWPNGLGLIVEVKTVPMRVVLGKAVERVPWDMAALIATDWSRTKLRPYDSYTDAQWWKERDSISRLWGLQLTAVHGKTSAMKECSPLIRSGINRGLTSLAAHCDGVAPKWQPLVEQCLEKPLTSVAVDARQAAAVLLAWASPIDADRV